MNDDTNQVFAQAYDLIEAERLDEAKTLLEPVLAKEKDNADAWWLYAHAVTDADSARTALRNVLHIEPNYPDAGNLLETLDTPIVSPTHPRSIHRTQVSQPQNLPPNLPETPEELPEASEVRQKRASQRVLTPRRLALLIPLGVIVIVAGLLVILNPGLTQPNSPTAEIPNSIAVLTETSASLLVTGEPVSSATTSSVLGTTSFPIVTTTPIATGAQSVPTPVSSGDSYEELYIALNEFTIPRNGIELAQTDTGSTLLVSICTIAGPDLRSILPRAMSAIASASVSLTPDIDAVGARMLNCGTNTMLLEISVSLDDAIAFANGELDAEAFQGRWRSQ